MINARSRFTVIVSRASWFRLLLIVALCVFSDASNTAENTGNLTSINVSRCAGCNLILLNIDFLRSDYTGLTSKTHLTANIDRFFANSLVFDHAYSTSGSSYRSGLSILTSSNPFTYVLDVKTFEQFRNRNTLGKWRAVYTDKPSITEVLKENNYKTVVLNKGRRSGRGTMLDRGIDVYKQFNIRTLFEDLLPEFQNQIMQADRPFFAMLHAVPTRLHNAYLPADRHRNLNPDIIYTPYIAPGNKSAFKIRRVTGIPHTRQRQAEHLIYQQQLSYADDELDKFFRFIEEFKDNSIIVLYSGHGTQIGDKEIYASDGTSYESNVRVPLFIRLPDVQRQIRISQRISLLDLAPTLLDMLAIELPPSFEGLSLLPLINGASAKSSPIYGKNDPDAFLIDGDWKLIVRRNDSRYLYKSSEEPGKSKNLYNLQKHTARILEYDPFSERSSKCLETVGWSLKITRQSSYELYYLKDDPLESRNLAIARPEILHRLLTSMEDLKPQANANFHSKEVLCNSNINYN